MEAAGAETTLKIRPEPDFSKLAGEGMKRLEAWLSLPNEDRAELLNGRIAYKAMASPEHGAAAGGVYAQLERLQGPPGAGGGWWISQDVDLFLTGQGIRPDVVGWRADKHPHMPQKVNVGKHLGVIVAPPDWVCEVLSVSTRSRDETDGIKWQAYLEAGVGHYWLVDLVRNQITVYQNTGSEFSPVDVAGRDSVKVLAPFLSIEFSSRRLFQVVGWLKGSPLASSGVDDHPVR